ncbi:unnamed protein product [Didymodactylos carnosus]|uniref:EF-hand domain-containing protein n=1 Tax=Didymodactylos carnosus TaxID=1234261 RepID=A0A814WKP3_9BILA|nr:unnamed protein product [Didymodactylos carnosus]CAF1203641.1 unnamed protein product [Didymodactylos carnosus]CAF3741279.1 unnamed protein product [Didymodactylos carnosus]CAF3967960.1 unnamed protein product [Didymodactylos carnosus]
MASSPAIGEGLTEANVERLAQVTGMTQQQVGEWYRGFMVGLSCLNKDLPGGKLYKRKFVDVYKQFYPHGKADKFAEYVFRIFDKDLSGAIDLDRNGYVDKKEMKKVMDAIYDLRGEDKNGPNTSKTKIDEIFSKMDKNSDNKLSKEEFINGCMADNYLYQLLAPPIGGDFQDEIVSSDDDGAHH